jgi:hypothetical protein
MKSYAVILMNAGHIRDYTGFGVCRKVMRAINNALTAFRAGKIRVATVANQGKQEHIQVHVAEQVSTPSLLLVKNGIMSNVLESENMATRDELTDKLGDLQTATVLLNAAEERFLLAVSKAIYQELPMDAFGKRQVTGEAGEQKLRKILAEYPALKKSPKFEEYAKRVFAYITKNANNLNEGIFTGAI